MAASDRHCFTWETMWEVGLFCWWDLNHNLQTTIVPAVPKVIFIITLNQRLSQKIFEFNSKKFPILFQSHKFQLYRSCSSSDRLIRIFKVGMERNRWQNHWLLRAPWFFRPHGLGGLPIWTTKRQLLGAGAVGSCPLPSRGSTWMSTICISSSTCVVCLSKHLENMGVMDQYFSIGRFCIKNPLGPTQ